MKLIDIERLSRILSAFGSKKIAVVGDIMLDRYLWGTVERISPEAPVPIVKVESESIRLGGAANVADNISALGVQVYLIGSVGADPAGEELIGAIASRGIDPQGVVSASGRKTTVKTRIIAHSQQVVRTDWEEISYVDGKVESGIIDSMNELIGKMDAVVVSDYAKGSVTPKVVESAVRLSEKHDITVCVDPKEGNFPSYRGVTVITPNQAEAGAAAGIKITDEKTLEEVGRLLLNDLALSAILITRGEHGMTLFERSGETTYMPTLAREVYDVTGAGDTVVSVLSASLAAGANMKEAALISNHAAGLVVAEIGTASVDPEDILESFRREGAV
jgi:D-beta-D-heptose 7-phosphate kinase/D-beta-D-heptose 1-phosphate adenosyltransferase